jgi:ATP-dependent DNA helicase RecQ
MGGNQEQNRVEIGKLNAMVGFAEAQTCRRRVLLGYFGERLEEDCGNCDVCLNPPERYDATEDAQKALSCVYRTGQRFGMMHVIEVLRGSRSQRIMSLGHDRLSTYGIGTALGSDEWGSLFRQLIHLGYLDQDMGNYSILRLTSAARPLLRGEERLALARPRPRTVALKKAEKRGRNAPVCDEGLFAALRAERKRLADEAGVPPFVVFGDATLMEMAAHRPKDAAGLLRINGVGAHKLGRYGSFFLRVIDTYNGA